MKRKFARSLSALCAAVILSASVSIGSNAAIRPVSCGELFDSDYYAAENADVVAAVGTDPEALYQHFVSSGASEGRHPYAPSAKSSGDLLLDRMEANSTFFNTLSALGIPASLGSKWIRKSLPEAPAPVQNAIYSWIYANLKDPGSAQIRIAAAAVSPAAKDAAIQPCYDQMFANYVYDGSYAEHGGLSYAFILYLNAKNSFGAYTGYKTYCGTCNIDGSSCDIEELDPDHAVFMSSSTGIALVNFYDGVNPVYLYRSY